MRYSYALSIFILAIQVACASDDGSASATPSGSVGGAGSSGAGSSSFTGGTGSSGASSSSTGGTGPITVVAGGLPDQKAATALSQKQCYIGLKLPNVTYSNFGCSASTTKSRVNAIGPNAWNDFRLIIDIGFNKPPAIGTLDLASLTIQVPNGDITPSWSAPVDACTATATDSAVDDFLGAIYYSIDISCTKPAVSTTDASLAPLTLDQFAMVTFVGV